MPSLTRLTTGGVLNPLKNTTNTSHNELLHQDPLQPPLEPRLDKWQKWVSALIEGDDCVVANLNSAADDLERNIKLQNEGKWGTEEGPQAFARVYKSYLEQEVAALRAMADNAGKFAGKVQEAITNLKNGEPVNFSVYGG